MKFEGLCYPTGIGSVPIVDPSDGCDFVRKSFKEIPFWPQLPKRSQNENMYIQYIENVPGVVMEGEKFYIRLSELMEGAEKFYEKFLKEDPDLFPMSEEYSAGYHTFMSKLASEETPYALKGQITGPVSFCMQVLDENNKALLHDDTARDILIKNLLRNAQMQEKHLEKFSEKVIMFLDEPYLVMFGSAFSNLGKDDVKGMLGEILDGLSCVTAVHCCGNTDWSVLLETSVDILSFDAFSFAEALTLYPEPLKQFFARGGNVAWGMIPTDSELLRTADMKLLSGKMDNVFDSLEKLGISRDTAVRQSLITPACGVGSSSVEDAELTFLKTRELSDIMRKKYF